jgi:hypothetical protein
MSGRNKPKLNPLLKEWPQGTVATQSWLEARGIYRQLTRRYVASDWLERLGRGAFIRSGDRVDWFGAVHALQCQLRLHVHIGGVTALLLKGLGHYLPLGGNEAVHLFSGHGERLPSWFLQYPWRNPIVSHRVQLFDSADQVGFSNVDRGTFSVRAASPERAILEVMHLAKSNAAIVHALELFNGLTALRPDVVQLLLEACRSVKVKRLFLWASDHSGHQWSARLDRSKVNLGRGKRVVYRGGRFDRTYQITVPRDEAQTPRV